MLGRIEGQVIVSGVYPFGALEVALFSREPSWCSGASVFETFRPTTRLAAEDAQVNDRQQTAVKHNLP